jgi:hypothetical protein
VKVLRRYRKALNARDLRQRKVGTSTHLIFLRELYDNVRWDIVRHKSRYRDTPL